MARPRLGTHAYSLYVQDSWKVTRKLTLDYGLRWDYAILWKEQYGRMQNAAFDQPNTLIGGRPGTVEYEATCKCNFSSAYPYAVGPHLGVAYQITPKTVFRAGAAISYGSISDQAGLNSSAGDFYSVGSPAYGSSRGLPERWESVRAWQPVWEYAGHLAGFRSAIPVPARSRPE